MIKIDLKICVLNLRERFFKQMGSEIVFLKANENITATLNSLVVKMLSKRCPTIT